MRSDEVTAEVLAKLRDQGWIKGQIVNKHGYCLVGAISSVVGVGMSDCRLDVLGAIVEVVREQFPERCPDDCAPSIVHWDGRRGAETVKFNDHPATTFADVELVLEKAIVKLEEGA